jgi:hypothetical protein
MPFYEYHCPTNGRTVEVRHRMSEHVSTWGEVVSLAGLTAGETPREAPVERLMSVTAPVPGSAGTADFQGCGTGCACAPD